MNVERRAKVKCKEKLTMYSVCAGIGSCMQALWCVDHDSGLSGYAFVCALVRRPHDQAKTSTMTVELRSPKVLACA
jgi:hypothetical protein